MSTSFSFSFTDTILFLPLTSHMVFIWSFTSGPTNLSSHSCNSWILACSIAFLSSTFCRRPTLSCISRSLRSCVRSCWEGSSGKAFGFLTRLLRPAEDWKFSIKPQNKLHIWNMVLWDGIKVTFNKLKMTRPLFYLQVLLLIAMLCYRGLASKIRTDVFSLVVELA